ncbi:choice-of-anchor K domain-containing protein [Candidatus Amarobacter glycogenicus]|uniref:choice-of-anchor K domain-containing protein n=1 Tax=Candidatus Amarobacter glycogenicus TaxID=3140699 RepID=UPI003136D000|nr:DUF11 domain-containing protein [Dehalococcoidia bacterium]
MTLALYGKTRRRQGILVMLGLFAVFAALIGGVAVQKEAKAVSFTLSTTNGTFPSLSGGTCVVGLGTQEVHWGDTEGTGCPSTANQSGYKWNGIPAADSFNDGETVYLGRFTHFNRPINGGTSISGATMNVNLAFSAPGVVTAPITITLAHEETSNSGSYSNCAYQIAGDSTPCPDRVVPTVPAGTAFTVGAVQYTLQLVAFERDADGACPALPTSETFTPSFVTAEGQENWGCLYGKIVIAKPDLTVIKTSRNAGDTSNLETVNSGTQFLWKFVVSNSGAVAANWATGDVVFRDNLPAGANYVLGTQPSGYACTLSSATGPSTFECTRTGANTTQAVGATLTFNVLATPTLAVAGTLSNPAAGGICKVDPNNTEEEMFENNNLCADTISVTIPQSPDLTVTKVAKKGGVEIDSVNMADPTFQWIITVANVGNTNAVFGAGQDILEDDLPAGATYGAPGETSDNADCTPNSSSTGPTTVDCDVDTGETFTLAPGGTWTVTIDVTPTTPGTLLNPAAGAGNVCKVDPDSLLTEANEGNNDCSDTVTVTASGTIVVHKEEAGSLVNSSQEWDFALSGGTSKSPIQITDAGQQSFTGIAPGTYTVTETDTGSVATCGAVVGSYVTTHGTETNPTVVGQAHTGISVAAGETKHVYFKNTACPGTLGIAKTSTPQDSVAAGGTATWTVTVTVGVNPTTAVATISDTLPPGWVIGTGGVTDNSSNVSCTGPAGATSFTCTLQNNSSVGTKIITVPVVAPANFPQSNCTTYTNTATITGGGGTPSPASASDDLAVTGCINPTLTLSKSSSAVPSPLGSGGTFNWVLTAVVSSGPTVANATITDTLPPGFTVNGTITDSADNGQAAKMTCTPNGAVPGATGFSCTLASTAANGTYTITVPVKAPTVTGSTQCVQYTNVATATFAAVGGVPGGTVVQTNNSNSVTVTCPTLSITKSAVDSNVDFGQNVQFDIVVTNTSGVPATGVTVSDTLPTAAGLAWQTPPTETPLNPGTCNIAGNVLSCSGIELNAGASVTLRATATTSTATTRAICGPHTNPVATATVLGVASNSGPATVTVNCPSITISKVANPVGPVNAGANIGWTFTVSNSTSVEATGVSVTDSLPSAAGVSWLSTAQTSSVSGACAVSGPVGNRVLNCSNLTVPAGGSITVSVTGTTTSGLPAAGGTCGTITNTGATASLLGITSEQGTPASVLVNCPDPSVSKTGNGTVTAGDNLVFTVTVTAGGTGTQSVVLNDTMPGSGLSWTKGGADAGACTPGGPVSSGSAYTCTFNNLNPGDTRTVTFTAPSNPAMCSAQPISNTATIHTDPIAADVNGSNNSSTATITVNCPNVTLTKTAVTPGPLNAGDDITFTMTATNSGAGAAKGFAMSDTLSSTVTGWNITAESGADCDISGNVLSCPGSSTMTLGAGATVSVTVTGKTTAASCTEVSNTVTAVATNSPTSITPKTANVTVRCPDVKITKVGNGPLNAGDLAIYTVTVENIGLGEAKGVQVSDSLPAGITWAIDPLVAGCSINTAPNPDVLTCSFATLAAAAKVEIRLTGTAPAAVCGLVSNTATVSATNEPSSVLANNTSTDSIGVNCASIKVEKVADASAVSATDNIGFTIRVWNEGAGTAYGVQLTDALPANAGLAWAENPDDGSCSIASNTLTCNFGNMPPTAKANARTVHIASPTTVATCGEVNNVEAVVTTTNDGTAREGEKIQVNCPDVTVEKDNTGQATISAGGTMQFTITVTVSGTPGTVAKNVELHEVLPAGTSGWDATSTTPSGICATLLSNLLCQFGNVTVPASGSTSFVIVIEGEAIGADRVGACGNLTNAVTVSAGNESNTGNNSASDSVVVNCPNIVVTKEAKASPINAGDEARFIIKVKNTGAGTATGVEVKDSLPNQTGLTWNENHADCSITGTMLNCSGGDFASMAPNDEISIEVYATTTPAHCTVLTNYALASAGNDQYVGTADFRESPLATITVQCPDISVLKTADNSPISAGDTASFTITVSNSNETGTGTASGVHLSDTLPSGVAWSINPSVAACSITNGVLSCDWATLAKGASVSVTVTGATGAAQCGELPNTATATATNEAAADGPNNSSATIVVNCPDLEVKKTPDGGTVNAGENVAFTIEVKNVGDGVARDVVLTDTVPTGFAWTPNPAGETCEITAGVLTCEFGDLAKNATASVTLTAATTAAQCQAIPNTASAASTFGGGDTATDGGDITVLCPDVVIEKVADKSPVGYGEQMSFTIKVTNLGPGVAKDVVVTDVIPVGPGAAGWTTNTIGCQVDITVVCTFKEILPGDANAKTIIVTSVASPATCEPQVNSVTVTAANEPAGAPGANADEATIEIECGTVQIIKIDNVGAGNPNLPGDGDWDFNLTRNEQAFASRSIPIGGGGGSVTIDKVPYGTYAAAEVEAIAGQCPEPNPIRTYRTTSQDGAKTVSAENLAVTFTFLNTECGIVASTGTLIIQKVEDLDGDHAQDPGEPMLANWPMTVSGPQFPAGQVFTTDASGQIILPGVLTGVYTVTEGAKAGYQPVGIVVDDDGPVFTPGPISFVSLAYSDVDTITFYNRPLGSIVVSKTAVTSRNGGPNIVSTDDDDGWTITVSSAACGINRQAVTDSAGKAVFTGLPLCSDYQVSEGPVNTNSPDFVPLTPATVSNVTPGRDVPAAVAFTNRKVVTDPPCVNCGPQPTPTSTAVPPTSTPVPPTSTAVPSTPTPKATTAGERTPGPGSPTPLAPSTGQGFFGGPVGRSNLLLVLLGLAAIAGGLLFVGAGRRVRR